MNGSSWDRLLDLLLLPAIGSFLLIQALLFQRQSALGRSLARHHVAFAIAYFGVLLALVFDFFMTPLWRYGIRTAILATGVVAAQRMVEAFGGWRATWREVGYVLGDARDGFHARPVREKLAIIYAATVFVALVWLAEIL